jgi:hypothetical protein
MWLWPKELRKKMNAYKDTIMSQQMFFSFSGRPPVSIAKNKYPWKTEVIMAQD